MFFLFLCAACVLAVVTFVVRLVAAERTQARQQQLRAAAYFADRDQRYVAQQSAMLTGAGRRQP